MVPVPVTANNSIYDVTHVNNNIDAAHWAQYEDTWDTPSAAERIIRNITISKTYNIHANLCVPPNGKKRSNLQIATHGAAFDSRYWNVPIDPEQHSYVSAALDEGYSILTYDRLGTGLSDKPDAYTEVQPPAELEILRGITEIARSGKLWEHVSHSASPLGSHVTFNKFIHIGHSYGSILTMALAAKYPNLSDAAIFTSAIYNKEIYSLQTPLAYEFALDNDPKLFAGSKSGYLVPGTVSGIQTGFFSSRENKTTGIGGFEPRLLDYAYSIRQPVPLAVHYALAVLDILALEFTGSVQFVVAEFDFLVCYGDCRNTYNTTELLEFYPKAADINVHVVPGTGHGLPLHNKARIGFDATLAWLDRRGL